MGFIHSDIICMPHSTTTFQKQKTTKVKIVPLWFNTHKKHIKTDIYDLQLSPHFGTTTISTCTYDVTAKVQVLDIIIKIKVIVLVHNHIRLIFLQYNILYLLFQAYFILFLYPIFTLLYKKSYS